jgi:hypothetical protein
MSYEARRTRLRRVDAKPFHYGKQGVALLLPTGTVGVPIKQPPKAFEQPPDGHFRGRLAYASHRITLRPPCVGSNRRPTGTPGRAKIPRGGLLAPQSFGFAKSASHADILEESNEQSNAFSH